MKRKVIFFLSVILLYIGIGGISADARTINLSRTPIADYDSNGSHYAEATVINEFGMIIYDSDSIDERYQKLISAAVDSWNKALGRTVLVRYQDVGVAADTGNLETDMIDMSIISIDRTSSLAYGYSGVGYAISKSVLKITSDYLNEESLEEGSPAYVKAVSALRHEMGHALGLKHDYGLVMASRDDEKMSSVNDQCEAMLNEGILPEIPTFNIDATKYILENLSDIYLYDGYTKVSKLIANARLNSEDNFIIGASFFDEKIFLKEDENQSIQAINLATNEVVDVNQLENTPKLNPYCKVKTVYGGNFYIIKQIESGKIVLYAINESDVHFGEIIGMEIDSSENYINKYSSNDDMITIYENYNLYTFDDKFLVNTYKDKAVYVGTTGKKGLDKKVTVQAESFYETNKGFNYYGFTLDGNYYVINANAVIKKSDENEGIHIDSPGHIIDSYQAVSQTITISKNYNLYTFDDQTLENTYIDKAKYVGTTLGMEWIDKLTVTASFYYHTNKGLGFYGFNVDGKFYVVSERAIQ